MISNCGHDENGKYTGGKAGDQSGGEYTVTNWYSRPWSCVLRYTEINVGKKIAEIAEAAARNSAIGYDQGQRLTYYNQLEAVSWNPAKITMVCESDCSASTSANIIAAGNLLGISKLKTINPSNTTSTLRKALINAGFKILTESKYLSSDKYLLPGDVLLYDGHHVAINLTKGSWAVVEEKKSGWKEEDGGWRFYNGDTGEYVCDSWHHDEDKDLWYWFDGAGLMITNKWHKYNDAWYYLGPNGIMCTSQLVENSGKIYAVDKDGKMITGEILLTTLSDGSLKYPGLAV